ncbi:MAG: PIN domain-containing protein [Thermoanaerobaculia bacterium]|nr:PIN domain-containing protein [Thermoanaerobaculia bacterium]
MDIHRALPSCYCLWRIAFGAALSAKPAENKRDVLLFIGKCTILEYDLSIAESYAEVRKNLQAKGKPIPENDIWIAAAAIAFGLKLITRDQHFSNIGLLNAEFWK